MTSKGKLSHALILLAVTGIACKKKPTLPYGSDMESAIESGNVATVKVLLNAGVDPNGFSPQGNTPLEDAASASALNGNTEILTLLLDSGADPNERGRGFFYSALDIAATASTPRPAEVLVRAGSKLDDLDTEGDSPLSIALRTGHADTAKLLIDDHADVNLRGGSSDAKGTRGDAKRSAIFYASRYLQHSEVPVIIQMLIDHGGKLPADECILVIPDLRQRHFTRQADELSANGPCSH